MVGLGRERERVPAQDQKAIVADIRNAGLRVLRNHDAGRDIGTAVLGAVGRDREARDVDRLAFDQHLLTGRRRGGDARGDRLVEAAQHLLQDGLLVRLERQQRLAARRIDAGDQRKLGAVVVEHEARALPPVALLHGLADVAQCHRPVDVDQFAMLAQHIQELAKVGIGHCDLRNARAKPRRPMARAPPPKKRGFGQVRGQLGDEANPVGGAPGRVDFRFPAGQCGRGLKYFKSGGGWSFLVGIRLPSALRK